VLDLFTTAELRDALSLQARVRAMLDFERALAAAQAQVGLIPPAAATAIAAACDVAQIDLPLLGNQAVAAGNLAIPLVRQLTRAVQATDSEAARFVHWGATSQDVIDTGMLLQLRDALALIESDLAALATAVAERAEQHKRTLMPGRTWLQQATPITFGLKAAGWLSAIERDRARLAQLKPRLFVLQFGGAAGTLASLGRRGLDVAAALAAALDLALPELPWHTQRDRFAEIATTLGILTGTLGKAARDLASLMQTEVAEAFEPAAAGKGGSSTMPHKRNPVGAAITLAAATRVPSLVATMLAAMPQEHERGFGNWHAEWDTLPEIVLLAGGATQQMRLAIEGLEVDRERMRTNLDATRGMPYAEAVSMALAEKVGKAAAHHLVEACARAAFAQRCSLRETLAEQPAVAQHLSPGQLDQLFDPRTAAGLAEVFVERALQAFHRTQDGH
jgi:3-carboxy-cis,cis-muconate cycloisomerase